MPSFHERVTVDSKALDVQQTTTDMQTKVVHGMFNVDLIGCAVGWGVSTENVLKLNDYSRTQWIQWALWRACEPDGTCFKTFWTAEASYVLITIHVYLLGYQWTTQRIYSANEQKLRDSFSVYCSVYISEMLYWESNITRNKTSHFTEIYKKISAPVGGETDGTACFPKRTKDVFLFVCFFFFFF